MLELGHGAGIDERPQVRVFFGARPGLVMPRGDRRHIGNRLGKCFPEEGHGGFIADPPQGHGRFFGECSTGHFAAERLDTVGDCFIGFREAPADEKRRQESARFRIAQHARRADDADRRKIDLQQSPNALDPSRPLAFENGAGACTRHPSGACHGFEPGIAIEVVGEFRPPVAQ